MGAIGLLLVFRCLYPMTSMDKLPHKNFLWGTLLGFILFITAGLLMFLSLIFEEKVEKSVRE
jgi:hypothetical protein